MRGQESFIAPPASLQQSITEPTVSRASARDALASITQASSNAAQERAAKDTAIAFTGRR
jgi:hypothetical protein